MADQQHRSDARVLNARTVQKDFRRLTELIAPGMRVLDVGCGTGAITAGIAELVGATGLAVGLDRDPGLLAEARTREQANLRFVEGDALSMNDDGEFDIVGAARVLQWIDGARLSDALANLVRAARPGGGRVVVLDYDHTAHTWTPDPPREFSAFMDAFRAWRDANRWRNSIARDLPGLLREAGLSDVTTTPAPETCGPGDSAADIWPHVMESLGPRIVDAGFLTQRERNAALEISRDWVRQGMRSQTMVLAVVEGRRA